MLLSVLLLCWKDEKMNRAFQWMFSPDNPKKIVLMRGLPSSGKSTLAKVIAENNNDIICSADHFFGETCEEYIANWSLEKMGLAHKACIKKAKMLMQRQNNLVVIDNTNTRVSEMNTYFEMAVDYQYKVEIQEPTSPWWLNDIAPYLEDKEKNKKQLLKACKLLWEKNKTTHGVPLVNIEKMMFRYHYNVTVEQLAAIYARDAEMPFDEFDPREKNEI